MVFFSGDETQSHQGLFDTSFQSLGANGDAFGDEGMAFDLVGNDLLYTSLLTLKLYITVCNSCINVCIYS